MSKRNYNKPKLNRDRTEGGDGGGALSPSPQFCAKKIITLTIIIYLKYTTEPKIVKGSLIRKWPELLAETELSNRRYNYKILFRF